MRWPRTGAFIDTLRLASGLVLFGFALSHFLNHALGLWSLDAMAAFQQARLAATRSTVGTVALGLPLLVHLSLALWRIARLRTWRVPLAAAWNLASGAAIVFLLLPHLYEAGLGPRRAGGVMSYPGVLGLLWPGKIPTQFLLLTLVWAHGCVGLHYWLRSEVWWRRASHLLAALAALVPAAAMAGVIVAAREVARRASVASLPYSEAERLALVARAAQAQAVSLALMTFALLVALGSVAYARRRRRLAVAYVPGPRVLFAPGPTLLEISRAYRVPHLSICGGKARCSTCRVRVLAGAEGLAAPADAEMRLLRRIGADPGVRLACQIRPTEALSVARLLDPVHAAPAFGAGLDAAGVDRVAAVLFLDIRGFTRLSEAKLAFDVVYILNAFFAEAGRAVEASGGHVDKYIGDGLMAVFEHADGLGAATRNALVAVGEIDVALTRVNRRLGAEIGAPLALAMGLHGGRLVSGRIGYGGAAHPTVIGRVVNIAARLEALAKAREVELALSMACAEAVGLDTAGFVIEAADIRGVDVAFPVALSPRAADPAARLRAQTQTVVSAKAETQGRGP
jgi:adenylate cyclase